MIEYLGIIFRSEKGGFPSSKYYNIPHEYCYEVFDAISGNIIALVDVSNFSNSVCINNSLFTPIGESMDKLPLEDNVVRDILNHVSHAMLAKTKVSIIRVSDMSLFDRCDVVEDVLHTINLNLRNDKIDNILT